VRPEIASFVIVSFLLLHLSLKASLSRQGVQAGKNGELKAGRLWLLRLKRYEGQKQNTLSSDLRRREDFVRVRSHRLNTSRSRDFG